MLRPVSLPEELTPGKIHLCAMPGRYEALGVFEEEAAAAEVTHLLCLVSDEEISRKSPDYLSALQNGRIPQVVWRVGIEDYGRPGDLTELEAALDGVRSQCLDRGKSLVIHCAAGHGRTGMVATLLLMRMGLSLLEAESIIRRAGSAPDTAGQQEFLEEQDKSRAPLNAAMRVAEKASRNLR